jgi:hypothetical protein
MKIFSRIVYFGCLIGALIYTFKGDLLTATFYGVFALLNKPNEN